MDIIIICCDALRYDHVTPEIMPNLTRWASEGAWFDNCLSCGSHTIQSITWFLTHDRTYDPVNSWVKKISEKGIETAIFHTNVLMSDFKASFDTEIDIFKASKGVIGAELRSKYRKTPLWALFRTVSRVKSKITGEDYLGYNRGETVLNYSREYLNNNTTPSFTWIHLMDAHIGYFPPNLEEFMSQTDAKELNQKIKDSLFKGYRITESEKKDISTLYREEVRYLDKCLGDFLNKDRDELIILTADHGDELGEYGGYSHQSKIIPQLVHVPLIIRGKGIRKKTVSEYVSHLDLAPYIIDLYGLDNYTEVPNRIRGLLK